MIITFPQQCRAWKNHLRGVKQENQIELYQTLCILESKTNKEKFQTLIKQFIERWTTIEPEFIAYFTEHYANRAGLLVFYCNIAECIDLHMLHKSQKSGLNAIVYLIMQILIQTCMWKGNSHTPV